MVNIYPSRTLRKVLPCLQLRKVLPCLRCQAYRSMHTSRPFAQPATPTSFGSSTSSSSRPPSSHSSSSEKLAAVSLSATVQARDYPAYLSHYFFPRRLQQHFLAIRAFNIELAGIKENVSSEILGRIRVGWWRDAIKACYNVRHFNLRPLLLTNPMDCSQKRPPKHPVAIALAEAIHDPALQATGGLVQDHFLRIIEARVSNAFSWIDEWLTNLPAARNKTWLLL